MQKTSKKFKISSKRWTLSVFLLLISLLSSCAHNLSQKNKVLDLKSLPLQSKGRSRLTIGNDKILFSYISKVSKDNLWNIEIFPSLRPQELLKIDIEKSNKNKLAVGGTFIRSLFSQLKKEKRVRELKGLKYFLTSMGKLGFWAYRGSNIINYGSCDLMKKTTWTTYSCTKDKETYFVREKNDEIILGLKQENNRIFSLTVYPDKSRLRLQDNSNDDWHNDRLSASELQLDLFAQSY